MERLSPEDRGIMFGGAARKVATTAKTKVEKAPKEPKLPKGGSPLGMMAASEQPSVTPRGPEKKTKTTRTRTKAKKEPEVGELNAPLVESIAPPAVAEAAVPTPAPEPEAPVKAKTSTKITSKYDQVFKDMNKLGLMAISGTSLLNHTYNTFQKLIAASQGDGNKFRLFEDRSKNYLKPHFSLPSQWHQARITFGTP